MPRPGRIAFISHSGALAVAILDWSRERPMGFSLFASLGNQADLTETDMLAAAAEDPETQVIVAYLEGVADGRRFFETLRAVTAAKPVVVLKAGRSAEAARAVTSHTGALAGSDRAFEAAVKQAGAVRVHTVEALFDLAHALERQPVPKGRRLAVVTNGGGLGIVATDAARDAGLAVPSLGPDVEAQLRAVLPPTASVANPVDLVGDADAARFHDALHALGGASTVDAALVLLTAQAATDSATVARAIASATRGWTIPVVAAFVGGPRVAPGPAALEEAGIPCYPFPERAVAALGGMALVSEYRRERPAEAPAVASAGRRATPPAGAPRRGRRAPGSARSPASTGRLRDSRRPGPPGRDGRGSRRPSPRRSASRSHSSSSRPTSRTRPTSVVSAWDSRQARRSRRPRAGCWSACGASVPGRASRGCCSSRWCRGPRSYCSVWCATLSSDRWWWSGSAASTSRCSMTPPPGWRPFTPAEARAMLDELRMAPVLRGVRGEPPVDAAALAETISRFASLAVDLPDLVEVELNPLMVSADTVIAVDARATLG